MKRFILSALAVSIFFVGLGALVDKTRAKFKSDEKALELVAKARQALGGDDAIKRIQALKITGTTTRKFNADGEVKTVSGDTEIAMQFPDKFMRNFNTGEAAKGDGVRVATQEISVTVNGKENGDLMIHKADGAAKLRTAGAGSEVRIVLKKPDGTTEELTGADAEKFLAAHRQDGAEGGQIVVRKMIEGSEVHDLKATEKADGKVVVMERKIDDAQPLKTGDGNVMYMRHGAGDMATAVVHHNDFFKTALGLLVATPEGVDVSYTYGGERDLGGTACNVVVATAAGEAYRLYLDKSSNLPVGMSYTGEAVPHVVKIRTPDGGNGDATFTRKVAAPDNGGKDIVVFTSKTPDGTAGELHTFKRSAAPTAEYTVRFSDYRSVEGVQLPFRWTQTGGDAEEVFTVSNYEVNPANISQKFERQPVEMMKMRKPGK